MCSFAPVMRTRKIFITVVFMAIALGVIACSSRRKVKPDEDRDGERLKARFVFNADTAYSYIVAQCSAGSRTMNSAAHERCGEWIKHTFAGFGLAVESQRADLKGYDGTILHAENIIARYKPEIQPRLLLSAHWDSRPWADNDPDPGNHHTPVPGANDGGSGVAVMLELARILSSDRRGANIGIDFVCFDAEDYGTPQWVPSDDDTDTWALGAQYWAEQYASSGEADKTVYLFGILLDMVGGEGARFYKEGMSLRFAPQIVERVWRAAAGAGYFSFFPNEEGTYVTDDHVPVNDIAGIDCIDIIAHYPDCPQSTFGPTWHTVGDTPEHISRATLKAVGQTLARLVAEY